MAFFGLTALGPQNVFQAHLASFSDLHIFSQDDWRDAFLHVLRSKNTGGDTSRSELEDEGLEYEDMRQVLGTVFRGSPPIAQDAVRFMRAFEQLKEQNRRIALGEFLDTVRFVCLGVVCRNISGSWYRELDRELPSRMRTFAGARPRQ
jgi:hypothetical protein